MFIFSWNQSLSKKVLQWALFIKQKLRLSRVHEFLPLLITNSCFIKIRSKYNSNALLSLLRIFMKHTLFWIIAFTVFPHIVAAATILFWTHLVRKLFKFSFPLCNENLNSFLTRWGNYSRRGNYSREETIWGNTVPCFNTLLLKVGKLKATTKILLLSKGLRKFSFFMVLFCA